ncbi:hypothetical protein, partial [Corynebacterium pseudodiphtheriticum]|uniref:hypothetical protein n=1 Tax=Corynebacterium pseudodiphtheriticum TaxID=37637 RepID=UPI000F9FC3FB
NGGTYYLLRATRECNYSIDVIQAIISHPAVDLFVAVNGKKYRGSYAAHLKVFLTSVPISPLHNEQISTIEANTPHIRELTVKLRSATDNSILTSMENRRMTLREYNEESLAAGYGLDAEALAEATGEA